jgi:hypothetical protein
MAAEVVLSLLAHCERAGHRHFHLPAGVALEELQIIDLDWPHAANRPDNARHWIGVAGPVERCSRMVDVDSLEGSRESVRIAFAPYLSIGDDIETGLLLRLDREDRRVVLGFGQERLGDAISTTAILSIPNWRARGVV